ncbi:MAG TPA: TlpA disulfide reductase family protein [Gemmatimonadaceae bacterium]|jgi:thiol-disulfide isomerase/thioredoxin
MKRAFILVPALAMIAAACSKQDESRGEAFRPLMVGDTTPAYAAVSLSGDTVRVGAGTPVLLNVWATWCESCKEEMADLAALEKKYAPEHVKVVAVSVDNGDGTRVKRFAESEKLPFTVAHDPAGEIQHKFQAVGVPETYLVSGDGRLLWVRRGGLAGAAPEVEAGLDSAVAKLGR